MWPMRGAGRDYQLAEESVDEFKKLYMCEFPAPSETFFAGYDAAKAGLNRADCPYRRGDPIREDWLEGWKQFQKMSQR